MKNLNLLLIVVLPFTQLSCNIFSEPEKELNPSLTLWYDKPASTWTEALPIGNGRLGAMIYGGTDNETIQFNEETLWSGQPHDYSNPGASQYLDKIRQLLWQEKQDEATKLGNEHFMSQPFGQQCYLPFGNILLNFQGHEKAINYKRQLNLKDAVSTVFYEVDGTKFKREVFASEPGKAIILHLASSKNGALNFSVGMDSPHSSYTVSVEGNEIILKGKPNNYPKELDFIGNPYPESKLTFEARLKVVNEGGGIIQNEHSIEIKDAKKATLYLVAATSFVNYADISANPTQRCESYLASVESKSYEELKEEHIADYQKLFKRVNLDLGSSEISSRPTNERLISFKTDEDPSLVSLLYQYGRYLLISASRPGTLPANLQGIWNDRLAPPWDSKYTININTEMNYWPGEITNLSECTEPLIKMLEDLAVTGQNVAK
ncbi:MAG TPA: glycoside hydrolase family 95 protein, partial [Draconibacterium sp.]|nr:glycoside hydrolase family 95 protein [Draconibacterium sp.]